MKKIIIGAIAVVAVILMVIYCSTGERKATSWESYKKEVITLELLDTFVFEDPIFKVEYPHVFVPDSSQYDTGTMEFKYIFEGKPVVLRCFSANNDERWDDNTAADSAVYFRQTITNDSVTMRDMHPGHFYLGGVSKDLNLKFYEQYVVDKKDIYVFELLYSSALDDEQVENLKKLVHEWKPRIYDDRQ